jgi:hypothetical protein
MRTRSSLARIATCLFPFAALTTTASPALAQTPPANAPGANGTPPTDVTQSVAQAPAERTAPTEAAPPTDSTAVAVSAGGQYAAGNSRLYAATGQGKLDLRRGDNGFGAALVGNFAETDVAGAWTKSTENLQGKLRYDRYFTQVFGGFFQATGTHDAFQAITFRLNLDPGVKLIIVDAEATKFWGEVGYDFEFDDNFTDGNGIEQNGSGGAAVDANGLPYVIEKSDTIHSSRLFAGIRHQFNKEVVLTSGLEYLQGFGGSGGGTPSVPPGYAASKVDLVPITLTAARLNFDALLAAHVGGGFSLGFGITAKYNSAPLAGKVDLDSTGTLSLIYAFASPTPGEKTCQ